MKFVLPINVKMPTIVGILAFISMNNTTANKLKARISLLVDILVSHYKQLKFHAQLSW